MFRKALLASAVVAASGSIVSAEIIDLIKPTDTIVGFPVNWPEPDETPAKAIDNSLTSKYLNFSKENSGFTITPTNGVFSLIGLSLGTAGDAPERDPASVTIEGSNDSGSSWLPIITNLATPLPDDRGVKTTFNFSPLTAGTFTQYRVKFPTLKNSGAANSMQIAEVDLLADNGIVPPLDFTTPTDLIQLVNGVNDGDGDGGDPPGGENVTKALDNDAATKFLAFKDLGSGLRVRLDGKGPQSIGSIVLTTANDSPERDPASVTIRGTNDVDGLSGWTDVVVNLATPLPTDRQVETEFTFAPLTGGQAFLWYEVVFPTLRDATAANSMQIAEIRLAPEPGVIGLLAIGGLALLRRRQSI